MNHIQSKTVVLITGAFVSHHCWDEWICFFSNKGYKAIAPAWPNKDGEAETLRKKHPDPAIASVRLPDLILHYTTIVNQLEQPPILIGHSLGGLIVQILLNNGIGAAGVAIHSVPPKEVIPLELSFYKSNLAALGFFTSLKKTYLMPFTKWQYAFTNNMEFEDQKESYELLAVPESKKTLRGGLSNAASVDFSKEHAPLLFLAGSKDHCIPASLNRRNFNRYSSKKSITEFVVREGRNHFVLGQPTWEEDAEYILEWIQSLNKRR